MNDAEWNSFESQVGWAVLTLHFEFYASVKHICSNTVTGLFVRCVEGRILLELRIHFRCSYLLLP